MSSTTNPPSPASGSPTESNTLGPGSAQGTQGITIVALTSALISSLIIFGVQMFAFILLKNKLARIFKPKTYLVPERERTEPPPRSPWGWLFAIFRFRDREIIKKCGLDAYFFLRYLQTLLIIFVPLAFVLLPVLLPINYVGGRGGGYALEHGNITGSQFANITGLDQLAWGNVRPTHTRRYWAHLVLALVVIVWVCGVFFAELRVYIKVRQDYLTSAEHRLRASATTVLVSAIPKKWLTEEALSGLYDVFPGGIRNIWINRNFDELLDKIRQRDKIFKKLEAAETELVKKAKKAQKKQLEKDDKDEAKKSKQRRLTKDEREQKLKRENLEAEHRARTGGMSSGDPHQVPHTIDDAIEEEEQRMRDLRSATPEEGTQRKGTFKIPVISGGLAAVEKGFGAVGQGLGKGLGAAGSTVVGGARNIGRDLDNQLQTTHGFVNIDANSPVDGDYDEYGRYIGHVDGNSNAAAADGNDAEKVRGDSRSFESSKDGDHQGQPTRLPGNATRRGEFVHGENDGHTHGWWRFWKGPAGGFASPIPTGYEEGDEFPLTQSEESTKPQQQQTKGFGATIKSALPFLNKGSQHIEYPLAYNQDYKENATAAVWQRFLKEKERPTHRLARFSWTPGWLPGLPIINKKVDTIYWCREELARMNLEIEIDQKHPERFPLMNSAFIQFNHQVAAHMACQAVTHHVPKHMAPRTVEIAPKDVLWDNMSIKWWEAWVRAAIVTAIVAGMIILWAVPVGWTATLAQLGVLAQRYTWLHWLNRIPKNILQAIAGVLPALVLGILLALVPAILSYLAFLQGNQTGTEQQRCVQNYYFAFLFVQVFLIVSLTGGVAATLVSSAKDITSIPQTLATQLPKAANYFFSYMILQALSTSSGTLLQVVTLITWYIIPKLFDSTAREKWTRNTTLPNVTWGKLYPVYTNFACIALIYSVVSPIIIVFAIITFTLLWIAQRYNMLYVSRFQLDTGGLLYPRAINQTFTGLYVMELCLVGLFFLVRDEDGNLTCATQAIIMIVAAALTVLYQYLLNMSFSPLFRHLPITFEDEAVLRDQAFERAQARRLGLNDEDVEAGPRDKDDAIELTRLTSPDKRTKFNPVNMVQGAGSWAMNSGRNIKSKTFGPGNDHTKPPNLRKRKHRDAEEQKKIADALYGGIADDIEDLTPDERDVLVRHAFQHYALRARKPTIWIPGDDIGVSDDEVRRTRGFAGQNIWISNVGAALDGKCRVVYGRNPPDFSEIDIINL
ncbi:uncharacterized protein BP5553_09646 [Venustampulla echinocandica]|uniref:DUF221-domain-containing protein n=1 Tax=Venustampulla echinocandica TaxID=2656787 RepID=A0A370TBM1_9HELO|nr:uncharacterized protein BP5553_09646 [Venustampulla echinocandica]RDL31437.1 hypothetical protein BP5553_09646 [Venustampulla echinocandica]